MASLFLSEPFFSLFRGWLTLDQKLQRPEGVFRCSACGNFLFDSRDVLPGEHPHLTFDQVLPGGLVQSHHPQAKPNDVDCSICLSFHGRLNDNGFVICSDGVAFDKLSKQEVTVIYKMCLKRFKLCS